MIKDVGNVERLQEYLNTLDGDIRNLFDLTQGRVRLGDASDGELGENVSGQFQVVADTGAADTEFTVSHGLGAVPIGYLLLNIDKAGVVYDSGTAWTSSNVYLKCSVANCAVTLFLIK